MTEEDGGPEKPKKKMLDISKLFPTIEHDGKVYGSRPGSESVMKELSDELKNNTDVSPEQFSQLLLRKSLYPEDGDNIIDENTADQLASDPVFLEKMIRAHPEFYTGFEKDETNPNKRIRTITLERDDHEPPAEYLLRAYRDYNEKQQQWQRDFIERMQRQFTGLAGSLSVNGFDSLVKNAFASQQIKDIIKGNAGRDRISEILKGTSGIGSMEEEMRKANAGILKGTSGIGSMEEEMRKAKAAIPDSRYVLDDHKFVPPPFIENPIHQTNKILADVASSTKEMRELFAQQASMQSNLNTVATEILNNFVIGAKSAERSSKHAIWIALLAITASLIPFFYALFFDNKEKLLLNKQAEIVNIMKDIRDDARNNTRNDALIDQQQTQAINDAKPKRKTAEQ